MKSAKQKTPLQLHRSNDCGCSRECNPRGCVYQPFLDDWNFTPDVGNGQKRGEIFTPRFIIDKMIVDTGLFPASAVYEHNYAISSIEEAHNYVLKTVNEPAVGTANFTATILWHKIQYAYAAANFAKDFDIELYELYLVEATASIYAYDIDCGNLQVTKQRLLHGTKLNKPENIEYWVNYLRANTTSITENKKWKPQEVNAISQVTNSLNIADTQWGSFIRKPGVIDQLYILHTGNKIPPKLHKLLQSILDENIKLFNGISLEDTLKDENMMDVFICPGWKHVSWTKWIFNYESNDIQTEKILVRFARQIKQGKLNRLEQELIFLEKQKIVPENSLTSIPDFPSAEIKRIYNATIREIKMVDKYFAFLEEKTQSRKTTPVVIKHEDIPLW
jgi:hypothetical protein